MPTVQVGCFILSGEVMVEMILSTHNDGIYIRRHIYFILMKKTYDWSVRIWITVTNNQRKI